jgi:hypothetical protein
MDCKNPMKFECCNVLHSLPAIHGIKVLLMTRELIDTILKNQKILEDHARGEFTKPSNFNAAFTDTSADTSQEDGEIVEAIPDDVAERLGLSQDRTVTECQKYVTDAEIAEASDRYDGIDSFPPPPAEINLWGF